MILGKVHVFQGLGRHHVGEGLITRARNAVITTASKTDVQKTLRESGDFRRRQRLCSGQKCFEFARLAFLARDPNASQRSAPALRRHSYVIKKPGMDLFAVILGMKTAWHIPFKVSPTHIQI